MELVSPEPDLVIRPRLYETDLSGVCVPLSGVLELIGVTHRQARVVEIDVATKTACLDAEPGRISFDQLVFAAGSRLSLPTDQPVHSADTHVQALALQRALHALRTAADARPRIVVVGGGFTGLELAAELAGPLQQAPRTGGGQVTLIERHRDLASAFGPRARQVIDQALAELGVEVRLGVVVGDIDSDGVTLEDGSRSMRNWWSGRRVRGPPTLPRRSQPAVTAWVAWRSTAS